MRATSRIFGLGLAGLLVGLLMLALVLQHQSLRSVRQENQLLQQQVDQLTAQAEQAATEKQRLADRVASPRLTPSAQLPQEQRDELLRLRGEVARLRSLKKEDEQSRRDQMQAAQAKLTKAEAELAALTKLQAQNIASTGQLNRASLAVELLKAEANGEVTAAAQVRLRQAEAELEAISELYRKQIASEGEYSKAKYTVDLRRAELSGDQAAADQVRLRQAEEELARAAELRARSLISEADYNEAVLKHQTARTKAK
jgi:hypothetical protein